MEDLLITQSIIERFESFVMTIPFHSCHAWAGSRRGFGYGSFSMHGRDYPAHRAAWIIYVGPIPKGIHVCHKCDNPECTRIEHLFLGTHADNMRDMWEKQRRLRVRDMPEELLNERHKELLERRRGYYKVHAEKRRAEAAATRANDPDYNAKRRAWRMANQELYRQTKQAWRAKRKAEGHKPT